MCCVALVLSLRVEKHVRVPVPVPRSWWTIDRQAWFLAKDTHAEVRRCLWVSLAANLGGHGEGRTVHGDHQIATGSESRPPLVSPVVYPESSFSMVVGTSDRRTLLLQPACVGHHPHDRRSQSLAGSRIIVVLARGGQERKDPSGPMSRQPA